MVEKEAHIPRLQPADFDNFLFGSWRPAVGGLYELFHIERIENYRHFLELPVAPHRRSVYFFLFITKGWAVRSKGLNAHQIEAGELFCLAANQITALTEASEDVSGFYCHFTPEIFHHPQLQVHIEQDFPFFRISSFPVIKPASTPLLSEFLELLYRESKRNEPSRSSLISLQLLTVLQEIKLGVENGFEEKTTAAHLIAGQYKNLLSEHIYTCKTVTAFAGKMGITPNHLNKCVKLSTGLSAHELLQDMRVLEAKVLLRQSDLKIAEIAFRLGGFEPGDFTRLFKKYTGITPKEYRELGF